MSRPDLSVVLVGRNDGYGGDFAGRMQTCVKALAAGERLTGVSVEVVVVEWNPPAGRQSLAELLPEERPTLVRVVQVPTAFHESLENPDHLPLFEYLGKNVGVRRASGEAVLVINPDIIVFPAVLTLARWELLGQGVYVRTDRHDFAPPVPRDLAGADVFGAALGGVFAVHHRPRPVEESGWVVPVEHDPVEASAPVSTWPTTKPKPFEVEVGGGLFVSDGYHGFDQLHTGMPGDFLLASRQTWEAAGGYWERTDTFTHLDTYFMAQLIGSGARQAYAVTPYLLLHEDHWRRSSGSADEWQDVMVTCEAFASGQRDLPNGSRWGFADEAFCELTLSRGAG